MTPDLFAQRVRELAAETLPLPAAGRTAARHRRLFEFAREDVSLAKILEAHFDALAILAEAGRTPAPGALYAVWASESPSSPLVLENDTLTGRKAFSSGVGLVDRALVTAGPDLVEVDLRAHAQTFSTDTSVWQTDAFRLTQTGSIAFRHTPVAAVVLRENAYTARPGFWHGALGPAACWAGAVAGLLDYALASSRRDPHTLAHLAAIHANVWALESFLQTAGEQIDAHQRSLDADQLSLAAQSRALTVRHLIEQAATDTLRRFARAYGPAPLAMNAAISRRYHEADLYLRQSHAERDLESLAHTLIPKP